MYKKHQVTHSRKGFQLEILEASRFRDSVAVVVHATICKIPLRHCHYFCTKVSGWAWDSEKVVAQVEITTEQALAISNPGVWDYVFEASDPES